MIIKNIYFPIDRIRLPCYNVDVEFNIIHFLEDFYQ